MNCTGCNTSHSMGEIYQLDYSYAPADGARWEIMRNRGMKKGHGCKYLCYSCLNDMLGLSKTSLALTPPRT